MTICVNCRNHRLVVDPLLPQLSEHLCFLPVEPIDFVTGEPKQPQGVRCAFLNQNGNCAFYEAK